MKSVLMSLLIVPWTLNFSGTQDKAQKDNQSKPPSTVLLQTGRPVEVPSEDGSWAIQIVTSGGFAGSRIRDLIITSHGKMSTVDKEIEHESRMSAELLASLEKLVRNARTAKWPTAINSRCADCYVTRFTLYRRSTDKVPLQTTATWDDVSAGDLPLDLRELYAAVLATQRANP
jgi:hypothetical protein